MRLTSKSGGTRWTWQLISLSEPAAWTAALDGVEHAFNHTLDANSAFAQSTGYEVQLLVCESAHFKTVCPLAVRHYRGEADVFTIPGFSGFASAGRADGFEAVWNEIGRELGWICAYVQLHPLLPNPFSAKTAAPPDRVAYVLNLDLPLPALLQRMSQSRRRQLSRPSPSDSNIMIGEVGVHEFLAREAPGFYSARAASKLMVPSAEAWESMVRSPNAIAVQARRGDEIQAVSLFGGANGVADYLYNISTREGQAHSASLIWAAVCELRQRGFRGLNLGGGISTNDSIAEFKRRFGPDEMPIVTLQHVFNVPTYNALCEQSGAPTESSFFPAYHWQG